MTLLNCSGGPMVLRKETLPPKLNPVLPNLLWMISVGALVVATGLACVVGAMSLAL